MQVGANEFLNGREVGAVGSGRVVRSCSSTLFRSFILFLIITNILAVLTESIPEVDRWAGNQSGNVFGVFEAVSVIIFTVEYALRLFSAGKDLQHLYSVRYVLRTA